MDNRLYEHPLFKEHVEFLTPDERVALSYERAKLVMKTYCKGSYILSTRSSSF